MPDKANNTRDVRNLRLHLEQRQMLLRASGMSLLLNIACVCLFAILLSASLDPEKSRFWVLAAVTLMSIRLLFFVATSKVQVIRSLSLTQWVNVYTFQVGLSGLMWGSIMLFWEPTLPVATHLLLFLFPVAIAAGALAGLGAWMPTYLAFILPCLIPVVLTLLFSDSSFSATALPAGLFLVAMFLTASNYQGRLREAFALKYDNEQLVEDLSEQNDELRLAKEDAEQAAKVKGEFLARVRHELRTPMNGVLGMTQVLETAALSEKQAKVTAAIRTSAESLAYIIDDLLDFSKVESSKLKLSVTTIDVRTLFFELEMYFTEQLAHKGVAFSVEVDGAVPQKLAGDYFRLKQILSNLLSNAVKFTDSGAVSLKLWISEQQQQTNRLHFEVKDTGIGIAAEDLGAIFDSFSQADNSSTRSYDGVGLGLTVARELAVLMGGEITVQSEPGEGSTFRFDVPLPAVTDAAGLDNVTFLPAVSPDSGNSSLEGCAVLLVEDSEINQAVAEALLENLGCIVSIAENGKQAVGMVDKKRYDIVLMDCQMPVMDGYEATRAIRKLDVNHDVPIVALTANAMHGDREKCLQAGMDDYLSKPFRIEKLQGIFNRLTLLRVKENSNYSTFRGAKDVSHENTEKALDQATFENLRQLDNGKGLIGRVISAFKKSIPVSMQSLGEGIKEGDSEKVSMSAHTMKSSSANLGALAFSRQCGMLEAMAREGDLSQAAEEFSRLEALLVPVQQELDEEFAQAEMRKAS